MARNLNYVPCIFALFWRKIFFTHNELYPNTLQRLRKNLSFPPETALHKLSNLLSFLSSKMNNMQSGLHIIHFPT